MVKTKMCEKCGHDHNLDQQCKHSFCVICGLGGDLTTMSCEEHQQNRKRILKQVAQDVADVTVPQLIKKMANLDDKLNEVSRLLIHVVPFGCGSKKVMDAHVEFETFKHHWLMASKEILDNLGGPNQ